MYPSERCSAVTIERLVYLNQSVQELVSIEYLSHTISADGLAVVAKKLTALLEFTFPTSLRGVQSFLGTLNFYGRFIEHFATIAALLYE